MQTLASWIPQQTPPPLVEEVTKQHMGFNYVHITTTYPSGSIEERFECNCHTENTEAGIKAFMEEIFH